MRQTSNALDAGRYHFDWVAQRLRQEQEGARLSDMVPVLEAQVLGVPDLANAQTQISLGMLLAAKMRAAGTQAQVFEPSSRLLELFATTDIASIIGPMVGLPYDLFYVHLTQCPITIESTRSSTPQPLTGLYVELDDQGDWTVAMVSRPEGRRPVLLPFVWPQSEWSASGLEFEDFLVKTYGEEATAPETEHYRGTLRVLVQLLLYLSGGTPDVEELEDTTRVKLERKAQRFARGRRGEKALSDLTTHFTRSRVQAVGWKEEGDGESSVEVRGHWVRGHWKGVWQGTGDTRVKMPRWIRPYRKGRAPEHVEGTHTYKVK